MRRTKIVATIGPAALADGKLEAMIGAGVDVVRINLSHGSADDHRRYVHLVRGAAAKVNRPHLAILFDTRGPEIRVGNLPSSGWQLEEGSELTLTGGGEQAVADEQRRLVPVTYAGLTGQVGVGDQILLDDGNITISVIRIEGNAVVCRVVTGGVLLSRKKVTLPRPPLDLPSLTPEDMVDLQLAVELDVDFVAASFVRTADDVLAVRSAIEAAQGDLAIIAKIENRQGVENIAAILEVADGLMVARGDLGVEMPSEEVPVLQKQLIAACNRAGKPVITATQMLESMVERNRPTRAEASDVANAIFDGTDAVMLSAETASGRYPVEAVQVMARIAERADQALDYRLGDVRLPQESITDAISYASFTVAASLDAAAILTATQSGHTARMVARHRPQMPIIAATPLDKVARQLSLVWGVTPLLVEQTYTTDRMIEESLSAAVSSGLVAPGALLVLTAGVPVGVSGTTNMVQVTTVAQVLGTGNGIGRSSCTGIARVARHPRELTEFNTGDILVTTAIGPEWMPYVQQAGGLVTEEGGLTSHGAVVALSLRIPAVVGVDNATTVIPDQVELTIDGRTGHVYQGKVHVR